MNKENQVAAAPRTTLVIERERWLRGDVKASRLRDGDGRMCCLGFFALARGLSETEIATARTPTRHVCNYPDTANRWPSWLFLPSDGVRSSDDAADLMCFNDEEQYSNEEREGHIAAIFAKHGVDVVFK